MNPGGVTDPSGLYGNASQPLASAVDFDDSSWRSVTVPHDWSIELLPQPDVSHNTGYFAGGLGWYRKTFALPAWLAGRSVSVVFDGVYEDATVYLNGSKIGSHAYGYTGFEIDVTRSVHADGVTPNVLAVVVQNQEPNSRWYSGSGITRNVWLTVTDPFHVARNGVAVTTPSLGKEYSSGHATVHATVDLVGDVTSGVGLAAQVSARILDAAGTEVSHSGSTPAEARRGASASASLAPDKVAATAVLDVDVSLPHLWSTTDPYLYTLEDEVEPWRSSDLAIGREAGLSDQWIR